MLSKPSPTLSSVSSACVSIFPGVKPASPGIRRAFGDPCWPIAAGGEFHDAPLLCATSHRPVLAFRALLQSQVLGNVVRSDAQSAGW